MSDFTTSFVVDKTPEEVFNAINNVRGWWGESVDGANDEVGDEFTYRVRDIHYSKLRVIDLVPNEKIVWLVLDNHMSFVEDQTEWVGTSIAFQIVARDDGGTEVRFAHLGLDSKCECFETCSSAWSSLMQHSLPDLITTGTGQPYS
ncbi:MAG TPA: SRPBCC domain-containing protein [Acidimicrobiales bacterium]|nr:SRPBCC domain-containing protein [Acidimicrobiales bacterium]